MSAPTGRRWSIRPSVFNVCSTSASTGCRWSIRPSLLQPSSSSAPKSLSVPVLFWRFPQVRIDWQPSEHFFSFFLEFPQRPRRLVAIGALLFLFPRLSSTSAPTGCYWNIRSSFPAVPQRSASTGRCWSFRLPLDRHHRETRTFSSANRI